jgi:predicted ATPase
LRSEREYPVPPLPLPAGLPADPASVPAGPTGVPLEELMASPAVALFVDRARAVRPDFELTEANAAAVAEICRRLEGLPLAIELAAARTRLLDPATLLDRLSKSLDALGTGAVDLPERQRTLRATVEWSVGLLTDAERSLLEMMAVFAGGWTVEAAAAVAGLAEDRALDLTEALARHSLVQLDRTERGPRLRMLETIREFVAERLAARPDVTEVARRHATYYRTLAAQADQLLRRAGQREWAERLQAEAGNLAAAVRWHLAHDRGPLPHLFRVLWLFWELEDRLGEVHAWAGQLLPTADDLGPQARAELLWTAAVTAVEMGDDPAALSARQRLGPLLDQVDDPFLRALCQLALAWTSAIAGDLDRAVREASASLRELRGQDAPAWTASAGLTVGNLETAVGRYDDALGHLTEVRDLAERFDNLWIAAMSQVGLGTLALVRGRPDEAKTLLDEALGLSLAAHSTRSVTFAWPRSPGGRSLQATPSGRRWWRGRPKACAAGPGCGRGRCGGRQRPTWWPRSGRHWGPAAVRIRSLPVRPRAVGALSLAGWAGRPCRGRGRAGRPGRRGVRRGSAGPACLGSAGVLSRAGVSGRRAVAASASPRAPGPHPLSARPPGPRVRSGPREEFAAAARRCLRRPPGHARRWLGP